MLERKQREEMEEMQVTEEWKKSQTKNKTANIEDSVGESSSSNQVSLVAQKKVADQSSGSYESDDFEDVSVSGSGSK